MKSFEQTFNPFDANHLNEYFRAKSTGKTPDFGVPALGWLPQNWLEIAEEIIVAAFVDMLQHKSTETESPTGDVDIPRLMWYDIGEVVKGVAHPEQTDLESAYRHMLSAAIKLKTFLVDMEVYFNVKGKLQ